jgi:hypothetical protein
MLSTSSKTTLAGVWSRDSLHAQAFASRFGLPAFPSLEALLDVAQAVAIAVRPEAQPDIAIRVAQAGKPVLLEKPVAESLESARRMAQSIGATGIPTMMMLTYRFSPLVETFLQACRGVKPVGARVTFVSNAHVEGPYATGWRVSAGCVLDIGPHVFDLVDAALGPIRSVQAHGQLNGWVGVLAETDRCACEISLCCAVRGQPRLVEFQVFSDAGLIALDPTACVRTPSLYENAASRFYAIATGPMVPNPLDISRGLYLQQVVDSVHKSILSERRELIPTTRD